MWRWRNISHPNLAREADTGAAVSSDRKTCAVLYGEFFTLPADRRSIPDSPTRWDRGGVRARILRNSAKLSTEPGVLI